MSRKTPVEKFFCHQFAFFLAILFSACFGPREVIINTETREKVVGFDKDCKYRIGKTNKSDFTAEMLNQLQQDSLLLVFQYASILRESKTLLGASGAGKYVTRGGIKPGDSVHKALQIYGKPLATKVEYWRDDEARIIWCFEGLFYKNLALLVDTTNNTIRGVHVGNAFEVDKKYRRKNTWLEK